MHFRNIIFKPPNSNGRLLFLLYSIFSRNVFGNPQVVEPFKNSIEMRHAISTQLDSIFDKFTDINNLFKKNEDTTIFSRIPYITDLVLCYQ